MATLNQCSFIGNVGKDPEMKFLPNGDAVANFSLAVTEKWKKDGEAQERTEWVRCVAFRKLGEIVGEYVKKGAPLYVQGKMSTRKWTDKDGNDRYSTEIIVDQLQMLGRREQSQAAEQKREQPRAKPNFDDMDDDIPF